MCIRIAKLDDENFITEVGRFYASRTTNWENLHKDSHRAGAHRQARVEDDGNIKH